VLLRLGDNDAKDTVLHASADSILVDANREGEGAVEFANAALADPVLDFRLFFLGLLLSFGDLGRCILLGISGILILNRGFVAVSLDGASSLGCFD